jgi:MFS family permease
VFYTVAAVASFCARFLFGKMTDRYGRGIFIFFSLLGYGLSMSLLTVATTGPLFFMAACLEGLSLGTLLPTTIALLTDRCPPDLRGTVFSIGLAGLDLGIAIAAPVFGNLATAHGYPQIFGISTGLVFLAALLFFLQGNRTYGSSWRFALGLEKDRSVVKESA